MSIRSLLFFTALSCSACGGHQALQTPREPARPAEAKPWTSRDSASRGGARVAAPEAAAAESYSPSYSPRGGADYEAREEAAPSDRARPGLATSWGETLHSPTRSVSFERADDDDPFDVATLQYDDVSGARRVASYGGTRTESVVSLGSGAVTVSLTDAHGRVLDGFFARGRTVAIGSAGDAYAIQVRNNTAERFEIVASVDGLDVIDGEQGDFEKPGYILAPWQTLVIDGFRQSQNSVAAFRFGSVADSYAASQGDSRNVGVIGVALFTEQGSQYPFWDSGRDGELRDNADPFPGRYARPPVWRH